MMDSKKRHTWRGLLVHCATLAAVAVLALSARQSRAKSASTERPNILIFVADDVGWRDFGVYGNDLVHTPNIDRLAEAGLRVEHAFLTTAQCSPSRISILTGMYPHATGAEDLHMPLPDSERIVPSYLQEQGYFTGIMAKRHLGPHGNEQFQWYDPAMDHDYSAFSDFLNEAGNRPFFMWVGFHDAHRPYGDAPVVHDPSEVFVPPYLADTPETRADLARYYDEIARMDHNIGRFLEELTRRGMRDNTLVIFLSDNGAPFPRAKGTVYDAGIRTPLIFSWPAQIEAGQVYNEGLVSVVDLAPTLLELAGAEVPEEMQGKSMRGFLEDPASYEGREYVFSERNWHDTDAHIRSVRTARYKLIRNAYNDRAFPIAADIGGSPSWFSLLEGKEEGTLTYAQSRLFQVPRPAIELYDLQDDPWELQTLADEATYREVALKLARRLDRWCEQTGDFPPTMRQRADHTDRITGMRFRWEIPPMRNKGQRENR